MPSRQTPKKKKTPAKAALSGRSSRRRGRTVDQQQIDALAKKLLRYTPQAEALSSAMGELLDEPIANLKTMVNRMMEQLTPREREVLNLRFADRNRR